MKKFSLLAIALVILTSPGFSQKVSGKLNFKKGQQIEITTDTKSLVTQEAMGQTVEFKIDGSITHVYQVADASGKQATLNHKTKHIGLNMDGMGQTQTFDSDKKEDLDGQMGGPVKEILNKSYEMTIDQSGKVLNVKEDTMHTKKQGDEADMVGNILSKLGSALDAPVAGEASFFKILPAKELKKGDAWLDSTDAPGGKEYIHYKLADVTPSEILLDYTSNSNSDIKSDMMGMEATTHMVNNSKGKITINRVSGILKNKTAETESEGTVDIMGQSIPIKTKTNLTINVKS
jgi:Family of unknown function (DUF6263)